MLLQSEWWIFKKKIIMLYSKFTILFKVQFKSVLQDPLDLHTKSSEHCWLYPRAHLLWIPLVIPMASHSCISSMEKPSLLGIPQSVIAETISLLRHCRQIENRKHTICCTLNIVFVLISLCHATIYVRMCYI